MGQTGRFVFVPRSIDGSMVGASATLPTGSPYYALYYEIIDGLAPQTNTLGYQSGTGDGKKIGLIAYDYIQARWSCLFTSGSGLTLHQNTNWEDDIGEIKFFMTTLGTPNLVDEAGNDIPYPKSFIGTIG